MAAAGNKNANRVQSFPFTPPVYGSQPVMHLKIHEQILQKIIAEIAEGGAPTISLTDSGGQCYLRVGDSVWTGVARRDVKTSQLARFDGTSFENVGNQVSQISITPTQQELSEGRKKVNAQQVLEKQKQRSALLMSDDEVDPRTGKSKASSRARVASPPPAPAGKRTQSAAPAPTVAVPTPQAPKRPWSTASSELALASFAPAAETAAVDTVFEPPPAKRAKKGTPMPPHPVPTPQHQHQHHQPTPAVTSPIPIRRGAGKTVMRPIAPSSPPPSSDDSLDSDSNASLMQSPSADRMTRRQSLAAASIPPLSEIVNVVLDEAELSRLPSRPIDTPEEFQQAYQQYNRLYPTYNNLFEQLQKNKEDFEALGRACQQTKPKTPERDALVARVKSLQSSRLAQIERMRADYRRMHEYIEDLRKRIIDYLNATLPGGFAASSSSPAGSRPQRAAAAAANLALSSNS